MIKADPKLPIITLYQIPHRSHCSKQGNPYPNYKSKSKSFLGNISKIDKELPTPPHEHSNLYHY